MNILVFYLIILLVILLFLIGIVYLSYWIPKKFGKKKLGILLSRILSIGVVILVLGFIFDDYLFFNWDAEKLLSEQNIELNDKFKILNNESGGLKDYYHKFELEISDSDKKLIIAEIKSAENYTDTVSTYFYIPNFKDRYTGKITTANYENENEFKTEYYKPNGKGIAPTYRIISISKEENKLTFEDIID